MTGTGVCPRRASRPVRSPSAAMPRALPSPARAVSEAPPAERPSAVDLVVAAAVTPWSQTPPSRKSQAALQLSPRRGPRRLFTSSWKSINMIAPKEDDYVASASVGVADKVKVVAAIEGELKPVLKMLLQLLPKCATWLNSVNDQTTSLGASAAGGGTLEGDPIIGPFVEWFHLEAESLQCSLSASSRHPREWLADSGKEGSARMPLTNSNRLLYLLHLLGCRMRKVLRVRQPASARNWRAASSNDELGAYFQAQCLLTSEQYRSSEFGGRPAPAWPLILEGRHADQSPASNAELVQALQEMRKRLHELAARMGMHIASVTGRSRPPPSSPALSRPLANRSTAVAAEEKTPIPPLPLPIAPIPPSIAPPPLAVRVSIRDADPARCVISLTRGIDDGDVLSTLAAKGTWDDVVSSVSGPRIRTAQGGGRRSMLPQVMVAPTTNASLLFPLGLLSGSRDPASWRRERLGADSPRSRNSRKLPGGPPAAHAESMLHLPDVRNPSSLDRSSAAQWALELARGGAMEAGSRGALTDRPAHRPAGIVQIESARRRAAATSLATTHLPPPDVLLPAERAVTAGTSRRRR